MRSFDSWLDRFCAKHRNLAVPNLMLYIVIGNVIVFVLDMFSRYSFSHMLTFVPYYIFHGQIWRLVTFIFVPEGSKLFFVAISLYFYYFIGNALEREWGSARFTVFYGIGVLVNIAVGLVLSFLYGLNYPWPVVSMYYINMSLFFAFAALYPDLQVLLFFIIPVKVKWLAWIDAAFFAWSILSSLFHLNWWAWCCPSRPSSTSCSSLLRRRPYLRPGKGTAPPARPSTLKKRRRRPKRTRAISINAPSAASPTPTTPTWISANAPSAAATTATAWTTSTTTCIFSEGAFFHDRP